VIRYRPTERLRAHPSWLVAAIAIRVCRGEGVVVADVAVRAGHNFPGWLQLVRARQRPACRAVIEDRSVPGDRVVARRAICGCKRRSSIGMNRVVALLPRRQVAPRVPAVGWRYV